MSTDQQGRESRSVSSEAELMAAVASSSVTNIVVNGDMDALPGFRLLPGQRLRGQHGGQTRLAFLPDAEGICCTSNNELSQIEVSVSPVRRAIWNDSSVPSLGQLRIEDVRTSGRVQILCRDNLRDGHVEVRGLHIVEADTRAESERPQGYGVHVLQGAFTLWNQQPSKDAVLTADLQDISVGTRNQPAFGTGVFVCGAGTNLGRVEVERLTTGGVYANGFIPEGTPDQISGGVFVLQGADVSLVENLGPVVTYGSNDMALDNWGSVDRWFAHARVTTHGPSAIGFVNFGELRYLRLTAPIETHGAGARGFNVYAGTIERADFDRIVTHGDGAVGIQISQPVGEIKVRRGIETFGATGPSLVKGVVTQLSAVGLSVKPGGAARRIAIQGGLQTHGAGVLPMEQEGAIEMLSIRGGFRGQPA